MFHNNLYKLQIIKPEAVIEPANSSALPVPLKKLVGCPVTKTLKNIKRLSCLKMMNSGGGTELLNIRSFHILCLLMIKKCKFPPPPLTLELYHIPNGATEIPSGENV